MKKVIVAALLMIGWTQPALNTATHATALVEGHGNSGTCTACHVPVGTNSVKVMWNSSASNATTYTLFAGANAGEAKAGVPASSVVSYACLSCHDGAVATNILGTATGHASKMMMIGMGAGRAEHPVNVDYEAARLSGKTGLRAPISRDQVAPGVPLFDGKVECATCHATHDGSVKSLRISNSRSALCLACHVK